MLMRVLAPLAVAIQARVPVLLWGPPGTGKSSSVLALGRALGVPVEVVIASIREPADFAGLPVPDGVFCLNGQQIRSVHLAPPAWAVRLAQAGRGILFLDEISTAPPAVQAALLRVILDRVVGDLSLPPGVAVAAAANPPEQAAGGWDLAAPLANRFCHLTWGLDASAWADGMLRGWPAPEVPRLPEGWETDVPAARALVASFIRARPHLLLQVPREESRAGGAWPSPRTWDMAARLLAACAAAQAEEDVEAILLAGCVGEGPAHEFLRWRRELDLPDPEELLAAPESFQLPPRGDQQYAVLAAVVAAAVREPVKRDRLAAAWRVIDAARQQGGGDIAAWAVGPLAEASSRVGYVAPEARHFRPLLQQAEVK